MKLTLNRVNYKDIALIFLVLIMAFLYALSLSTLLPVDESIKDRINYLVYARESDVIFLRYFIDGNFAVFFNEPVWLFLNFFLSQFFEPDTTVRFFIFLSAFITSFLVLKVDPKFIIFLLFFLVFPGIIGKFVIHLRQGVAISIFLLGWLSVSKSWRCFLFILTPLIHSSFFFVIFLYTLTIIFQQLRFALDLRLISIVTLGVLIGFGLGFLANLAGARQSGEYDFDAAGVSGLGFLFWLGILVIYCLEGRVFSRVNMLAISAIVFYLTTYFLIEVSGRIFESMIVIVLLAGLNLSSWRRMVFIVGVIFFVSLSWALQYDKPWLGWGTGL